MVSLCSYSVASAYIVNRDVVGSKHCCVLTIGVPFSHCCNGAISASPVPPRILLTADLTYGSRSGVYYCGSQPGNKITNYKHWRKCRRM